MFIRPIHTLYTMFCTALLHNSVCQILFIFDCGIQMESDEAIAGGCAVSKDDHVSSSKFSKEDVNKKETEQPTREDRSLTDHLNKRLLEHFMQKLDSNDPSFPKVGRIDTSEPKEDSESLSNDVQHLEVNSNK